mmetsp:Transcript_207/g.780  ORF Transcript_207/g.780 Transcript_207/m.780 type:complete len:215 (-) Transcript_207:138-782(-)
MATSVSPETVTKSGFATHRGTLAAAARSTSARIVSSSTVSHGFPSPRPIASVPCANTKSTRSIAFASPASSADETSTISIRAFVSSPSVIAPRALHVKCAALAFLPSDLAPSIARRKRRKLSPIAVVFSVLQSSASRVANRRATSPLVIAPRNAVAENPIDANRAIVPSRPREEFDTMYIRFPIAASASTHSTAPSYGVEPSCSRPNWSSSQTS